MKQVVKILVGLSICACIGTFFLSSCGGGETTSTEDHRYDVFTAESMLESIQSNKNISLQTDLDLANFEWPLGLTYSAKFVVIFSFHLQDQFVTGQRNDGDRERRSLHAFAINQYRRAG